MLESLLKLVDIKEGVSEDDVKSYLEGLTKSTPEGVQQFLETDEGKRLLQPILDRYHTKSLETWKEKSLPKLIDEKIKELYPDETPEQKKLRELEQKLTDAEKARIKESLRNKALSIATQKGLPLELVDYFVGPDEDTTISNLDGLDKIWKEQIKVGVESKFKDNGRTVHRNTDAPKGDLEKLDADYQKAVGEKRLADAVAIKNQIHELQQKQTE